VIIGGYVLICKSLIMVFIANLALDFLIFSPVDSFHIRTGFMPMPL